MKRKTILMTTAMFVIALLFAGCGDGSKKDEETSKIKDEEKVEESSAKKVTTGMTDDILVEIVAQSVYIGGKDKDATDAEMENEMKKVLKKIGVTMAEYEAYMEKLGEENPEHFLKLYERAKLKGAELLEKEGK